MSRFDEVRERVQRVQDKMFPMMIWMSETAKKRISKGRVALMENGIRSRALELDPIEKLVGFPDGLVDSEFEFKRGDQCMI